MTTRTSPPACPQCRGNGETIELHGRYILGMRRCRACDGRGSPVVDAMGEYPNPCRTLCVEERGCGYSGAWWSSRCTRCGGWSVRANGVPATCACLSPHAR